jgi:hypothetical protein
MLGISHSHSSRVRLLLELAGQACVAQGFVPVVKGHVALDVVVRAPAGQNPADATNYLGGIGDVLEDKSSRGPLDHLGPLSTVWLYRNDRQITQVSYREVESGQVPLEAVGRRARSANCARHRQMKIRLFSVQQNGQFLFVSNDTEGSDRVVEVASFR